MGKLLILIVIFILIGMLWSLPLYICANFVLWLFHIPFHLTWLQSLGLCLLVTVIRNLIFKNKENS